VKDIKKLFFIFKICIMNLLLLHPQHWFRHNQTLRAYALDLIGLAVYTGTHLAQLGEGELEEERQTFHEAHPPLTQRVQILKNEIPHLQNTYGIYRFLYI